MFKRLSGLKKYIILAALVFLAVLVGGCSGPKVTTMAQVPRITSAELENAIRNGANIVVVDTRTLDAYGEVRLPGSVSIPLDEIVMRADELKGFDQIVTYCT